MVRIALTGGIILENLIGAEEVSQALDVELDTIYAWVNRRKIPFVKVGGALRFRPSALEAWLKDREHTPDRRRQERLHAVDGDSRSQKH